MALDAEDQARLRRIESDLASADPALARRLRSWQPSAGPPVPGWSVVPGWALAAFLVGFACWMLSPVVGALVVGGLAGHWLWTHVAAQARRRRDRTCRGE